MLLNNIFHIFITGPENVRFSLGPEIEIKISIDS